MQMKYIIPMTLLVLLPSLVASTQLTNDQADEKDELQLESSSMPQDDRVGRSISKLQAIIKMHHKRAAAEIKEKIAQFFQQRQHIKKTHVIAALLPLAILMKAPLSIDLYLLKIGGPKIWLFPLIIGILSLIGLFWTLNKLWRLIKLLF